MFVFITENLYGINDIKNVLSIYHGMYRYDMHNNMFVEEGMKVHMLNMWSERGSYSFIFVRNLMKLCSV